MSRSHRLGALVATGTLLATVAIGTVAAPAAAGPGCTYDMPKEMDFYDPTGSTLNVYSLGPSPGVLVPDDVLGGVVVCGGPGHDLVGHIMSGGTFFGRGGNDQAGTVWGTFYGGPGKDLAYYVEDGGKFNGGKGADEVDEAVYEGGQYIGSKGSDYADRVYGKFVGGGGADEVENVWLPGVFIGGPWKDRVGHLNKGTSFYGNKGADHVDYQHVVSFYNGGPGKDVLNAEVCGGGTTKSVEQINGDVC